jgi:hypothetical protein
MNWFDATRVVALGALALLVPLSVTGAQADPTKLTFEAVETATGSAGVLSELYRKTASTPSERMSIDGKAAARFEFEETDCSVDTKYMVVPVAKTMYTYPLEDWRFCKTGGAYRFEFTPNLKEAGSADVYSFFNIAIGAVGGTYAALTADQTDIMRQALQKGDLGTVSYLTTELSFAYYKAGNSEVGDQLKAVALVSGWEAVTAKDEAITAEKPFVFSGGQLAFSSEGVDAIKAYQAKVGLVDDGKLNWKTMRSLSDLAQQNVTALGFLKADVLKGFDG